MENEIFYPPTNERHKDIEEIFNTLNYSSYEANRGYGMTHEQLVNIGVGTDEFKAKYETKITKI